jgi:hypothetical protein
MKEEVIEVESELVDLKAALTGEATEKTEERPFPELFKRVADLKKGDEVRVTVQDISLKVIKRATLVNVVFESRAIILKMGQKAKKFTTYAPIVVDDEVYTCIASDHKKKLVMFTHIGPHGAFSGVTPSEDFAKA